MLEAAEKGKLAKADYEAVLPGLRTDLVNAQYELRSAGRPVLVTIAGDDRPGATALYNVLHEWLDARYLASHAWAPPDPGEELYPPFWRYWRALPPKGALGVWLGGWLQSRLRLRLEDALDDGELARSLDQYRRFEVLLAAEGFVLLKLWIHLSNKQHAKRLAKASRGKGEWRLDENDWRIGDDPEAWTPLVEEVLARTQSDAAPWLVVSGANERHRDVTVGRAVLAALGSACEEKARAPSAPLPLPSRAPNPLDAVDLTAELPYEIYKKRLAKRQRELFGLVNRAEAAGLRPVLVFQGWDAAGKGGAIRRITHAIDARDYRVVRIAAPSEEERRHPWLWRFWRHLTPAGRMVIFDRSWYGRVLVERVEGFASEADWRRAYDEIVDFEAQLAGAGSLVMKFFLHIDADEQIRRFRAREHTPYKKYKITEDDYRNREKRPAYMEAAAEMFARTGTETAPWHLVPANDKRWARVAVLDAICATLRRALPGKAG